MHVWRQLLKLKYKSRFLAMRPGHNKIEKIFGNKISICHLQIGAFINKA
jgi:hypothetical protein